MVFKPMVGMVVSIGASVAAFTSALRTHPPQYLTAKLLHTILRLSLALSNDPLPAITSSSDGIMTLPQKALLPPALKVNFVLLPSRSLGSS